MLKNYFVFRELENFSDEQTEKQIRLYIVRKCVNTFE